MDVRRLSTESVIAAGILDKPAPIIDLLEGRDSEDVEHCESDAHLLNLLEAGTVVRCPEYYGIPIMWRTDEGVYKYKCVLLQYRSVTEERDLDSAQEAVEWFKETAGSVAG